MHTTTTVQPRDLGVPIRAVFHARLHPGQKADGSPSLIATMGQHAGTFIVLDIDLDTGTCVQHNCKTPKAFEGSATFRSRTTGHVYVGACYTGTFHRYAPGADAIEDLGHCDPEHATFPCRIDEAPDGSIWVGSYPGCCLSRWDPNSGDWQHFGRMDETDMYFYPLCGSDGTVAGVVRMCNMHVVALDPATGEHKTVGPTVSTQDQSGTLDMIKGVDGLLYIKSTQGNFRIEGMQAVPVDTLPEPMPAATLPDGSTARYTDGSSFEYRNIEILPADGSAPRAIELTWTGDGSDLFEICEGPDGKIYGSSILPEMLFSCDPDGSAMTNHGQCSEAGGEAYSMRAFDGKLYIASYPEARLSIYDPAKPYNFGTDEDSNPRDIGRVDDVAFRPRAMVAGPAGKVWIGSVPDYGMWGGTLANYDPATGTIASHRHIIQDCSVTALAWLPAIDRLLVGLSTVGGSGTLPRAPHGGLALWNPHTDQLDRIEGFGVDQPTPIEGVIDLCAVDDGKRAYAACTFSNPDPAEGETNVRAELVLFDTQACKVIDRTPYDYDAGWPVEVGMQVGPDGAVYAPTKVGLWRVEPGTAKRDAVWKVPHDQPDEFMRCGGPIIGSTYYYGCGHILRAIDLPL